MKPTITFHLVLLALAFTLSSAFATEDRKSGRVAPLPGDSIQSYDYDDHRSEFLLTLEDGKRLLVSGVPARVYDEFNQSDKKVTYFNTMVRPYFKSSWKAPRKVSAKPNPLLVEKSQPAAGQCTRGLAFKIFNP